MKQIVYALIAGLCLPLTSLSAQNANDIVEKAVTAFHSSNGIEASFVIRTQSPTLTESVEGTIHMKGEKFVLVTPDIRIWYNGTAQWTYMEQAGEVNISAPAGEELQYINPILLLSSSKKSFTAVYKGEGTAPNGKAAYTVELTPKKKGEIVKVELQLEKYSGMPAHMVVRTKNGIQHTIQITGIKSGVNRPDSFFSFNPADYPGVEVIDLR
ncbi:MAG: hypothetical protein LBQ39_06885 [Tannerellaceae bacterium]|jgi:outer membrane lipoprotein-sorting protein|nr:hypothetical protein [Tannerellaceae bacterium]